MTISAVMLVAALMGSCEGDNKLSEQLLKQATDTSIDTILPPRKGNYFRQLTKLH